MGALLLSVPRWTCYGALLLAVTVGTATVLYVALLHKSAKYKDVDGPAPSVV